MGGAGQEGRGSPMALRIQRKKRIQVKINAPKNHEILAMHIVNILQVFRGQSTEGH